MDPSLFPLLRIPNFQEVQIGKKKFISSKFLYEGPKALFKKVVFNFINDEKNRKNYISRSAYIQFLKEYCKTNRFPSILKHAKNEWKNMDEQQKDMYRGRDVTLASCKLSRVKLLKKFRPPRCSYSIFIELKCKEKSRSYESLGYKWKNLPEEKKNWFRLINVLDKERAEFEKQAFARFELVLRLLGAASNKKIIKKHSGFSVFKDEVKASLMERGFTKLPNLNIDGRKKYKKLDKESKKKHKLTAAAKNEEMIEQIFEKVYRKANVDYGELTGGGNISNSNFNLYEEDFEEFLEEEVGFMF